MEREFPAWALGPTELGRGIKHYRAGGTCKPLRFNLI